VAKLDDLRQVFVTALGAGYEHLSTLELWDIYLSLTGYTGGLLQKIRAAADARGLTVAAYGASPLAVELLGSELAPAFGATWVAGGTGATTDAQGAHFVASSSTAAVEVTGITALDDNARYRVEFTVANFTQGSVRIQVYGDTTNHLGTAGPVSANGTYVLYVNTTATGSNTNRIRIQSNGPSTPGNTMDVTAISVKKVM